MFKNRQKSSKSLHPSVQLLLAETWKGADLIVVILNYKSIEQGEKTVVVCLRNMESTEKHKLQQKMPPKRSELISFFVLSLFIISIEL